MAFYLRSRLPHLRHAALSLPKLELLPYFCSPGEASNTLPRLPRLGAHAKGFCSQNLIGVDDHGDAYSHELLKIGKLRTTVKGNSDQTSENVAELQVSLKKGKITGKGKSGRTSENAVESQGSPKKEKMAGKGKSGRSSEIAVESQVSLKKGKKAGKGKSYILHSYEDCPEIKWLASLDKGREKNTSSILENSMLHSYEDCPKIKWLASLVKGWEEEEEKKTGETRALTFDKFLKKWLDRKKGIANWEVMKLCKQKRVIDILKFPPELLRSNKRLQELFKAWMVENDKRYKSQREKKMRFDDFKHNVFLNHRQNITAKSEYRLTRYSDHRPGMICIPNCSTRFKIFRRKSPPVE